MYQNRVSITGFVGNDAQLRSTKNGTAVRCIPSPPNPRGRTSAAAMTPGQSGIAAWPWGSLSQFAAKLE
jgi:hypothetical protein